MTSTGKIQRNKTITPSTIKLQPIHSEIHNDRVQFSVIYTYDIYIISYFVEFHFTIDKYFFLNKLTI